MYKINTKAASEFLVKSKDIVHTFATALIIFLITLYLIILKLSIRHENWTLYTYKINSKNSQLSLKHKKPGFKNETVCLKTGESWTGDNETYVCGYRCIQGVMPKIDCEKIIKESK